MRVFYKHGIISIDVNVLLGIERHATLEKCLDSINLITTSRPIEKIKTKVLEAIYPRLIWSLCADCNDRKDKLVLIDDYLVDVLHFAMATKGL